MANNPQQLQERIPEKMVRLWSISARIAIVKISGTPATSKRNPRS